MVATDSLGIRIIELADRRNQFCGKLFSDFGADVVQIEPLAGSSARHVAPFLADMEGAERSLDYWYYNTGKKSVGLDLETSDGRRIAAELASTADVFIESGLTEDLVPLGLDHDTLAARVPGLIQASITDFGQSGQWQRYLACDEGHLALGGQMAASGYSDVHAPPIGGKGGQSYHVAGVMAAQAIMAALIERMSSGLGQYLDCAIHDCCAVCIEGSYAQWQYQSAVPSRRTGEHAGTGTTKPMPPCADGRYVNTIFTELTQHMWVNLIKWMEEVGVAGPLSDPKYMDEGYRTRAMRGEPEIREGIARLLMALPAEDVARGAQERCQLAWSVVRSPEENFGDPHWAARGFFVPVEYEELPDPVIYPRGLFKGTELAVGPRGRSPRLGEHTATVLQEVLGYSAATVSELVGQGVVA